MLGKFLGSISPTVMNILALHGNLGQPEDFDFLSDIDGIVPLNLWDCSSLSLSDFSTHLTENFTTSDEVNGIIGYSMGGRIALHTVTRFPDRYQFAIIISAHPGLTTRSEQKSRLKLDLEWAKKARESSWSDFLDEWNKQPVLHHSGTRQGINLENYREQIASGFENWSLGQQPDLRPALSDSQIPFSWLVGENDPKFLAIAEEAQNLIPSCNLQVEPNCGHRVIHDQPGAVHRVVKRVVEQF